MMSLFTRQLILILLSQLLYSATAADDVSPPIRKRTKKRTLRGGSTGETDFDPFIGIGVARELSSESIQKSTGRSMSLSMSATSTPTPSTAIAFIDETAVPATSSPTTSPATLIPTAVMVMEGEGWFLTGGGIELEEPGTKMPVRSRKPTLLPTSKQLI